MTGSWIAQQRNIGAPGSLANLWRNANLNHQYAIVRDPLLGPLTNEDLHTTMLETSQNPF